MYILKKMHDTPDECNFTDESGHATKLYRTDDYSVQTGFVVKSDRIVNIYRINVTTLKLTKKFLFLLIDMANLNAFYIHKSCSGQMTYRYFWKVFICTLIAHSCEEKVTVEFSATDQPHLHPN
jgi:hypothetical protein